MSLPPHLIEVVQPRIVGELPSCTFGDGVKDIARNGRPPRVVWVPLSGKHGPAEKRSGSRPRDLLTRKVTYVAHCWGLDRGDYSTSSVVDAVLRQLYLATFGSVEFLGEEWPTEERQENGSVCLVTFALSIPVLEARKRSVKVTDVENDNTYVGENGEVPWKEDPTT